MADIVLGMIQRVLFLLVLSCPLSLNMLRHFPSYSDYCFTANLDIIGENFLKTLQYYKKEIFFPMLKSVSPVAVRLKWTGLD